MNSDMLNLQPLKKGETKKKQRDKPCSDNPRDISDYLDFLDQIRISNRQPKPAPKNFKKPFRL